MKKIFITYDISQVCHPICIVFYHLQLFKDTLPDEKKCKTYKKKEKKIKLAKKIKMLLLRRSKQRVLKTFLSEFILYLYYVHIIYRIIEYQNVILSTRRCLWHALTVCHECWFLYIFCSLFSMDRISIFNAGLLSIHQRSFQMCQCR